MAIDIQCERKEEVLTGYSVVVSTRPMPMNCRIHWTLRLLRKTMPYSWILGKSPTSAVQVFGVILRMAKKFNETGKRFAIYSLAESVRGILAMSGFDQLISIYESQTEAISAIKERLSYGFIYRECLFINRSQRSKNRWLLVKKKK